MPARYFRALRNTWNTPFLICAESKTIHASRQARKKNDKIIWAAVQKWLWRWLTTPCLLERAVFSFFFFSSLVFFISHFKTGSKHNPNSFKLNCLHSCQGEIFQILLPQPRGAQKSFERYYLYFYDILAPIVPSLSFCLSFHWSPLGTIESKCVILFIFNGIYFLAYPVCKAKSMVLPKNAVARSTRTHVITAGQNGFGTKSYHFKCQLSGCHRMRPLIFGHLWLCIEWFSG